MDAKDRERFRGLLARRRDALEHEGDLEIEPARKDPVAKPDDDAAPLTEMLQTIASSRNQTRSHELRQIVRALEKLRLQPEDFGLCEHCEEEIGTKRLELLPWATACVRCQSAGEDPRGASRKHLADYK